MIFLRLPHYTLHSNLTFYKRMSIAAHSILTSNKQSTSDATKLKGRKLVTGEGCGQADICEATDRELFHLLNCYSSDHSKRRDFSNAAVLKAIRSDPSSAKIKYPFIKHRGSPPILVCSPLFQIVGLPVTCIARSHEGAS